MPEYADITAFREWLNWLEEISNSSYPDHQTLMFYEIRDMLDRLPKVVRCKDCKHYRNHPNGLCFLWTEPYDNAKGYKGDEHCVEPDDYCSYGERKDNK